MDGTPATEPRLLASDVADAIVGTGVTHVLGIPDNSTAPVFAAFGGPAAPRLLRITREGEAFAMAAGLWIGGARPWVILQSTGLLESGDAIRGTVVRMGVPLPMLVSLRGESTLTRLQGAEPRPDPAVLRRPDVDSAAILSRATLRAWGIPAYRLAGPDDLEVVDAAWQRAREEERPVAVLLARPPEPPP